MKHTLTLYKDRLSHLHQLFLNRLNSSHVCRYISSNISIAPLDILPLPLRSLAEATQSNLPDVTLRKNEMEGRLNSVKSRL